MTDEEKLAVLRSLKLGHDKEWMTKPLKEALDYAIQCCESIQSSAKTMRHNEVMVPGIYLSKTAVGEIVPITIRQDLIDAGHVYKGLVYQGPVVWVES